jgi:DNA-binding GntR family transcriptional regulator
MKPARSVASRLKLEPIEMKLSFRDQAYAALKRAIAEADIYSHPKEIRLDERPISQALGVSRTPVREAMTLLERDGFLRTEPRRGIFIVRKSKRQIIEMIEAWAALESMAVRLVTERASDTEIGTLHRIFDEFVEERPAARIDKYSDANNEFHHAIVRLSGSELIERMTGNLFLHVRAIRRATIAQGCRAERSLREHMDIIAALECRDTAAAERLSLTHTLGLADYVEKHCDFLDRAAEHSQHHTS